MHTLFSCIKNIQNSKSSTIFRDGEYYISAAKFIADIKKLSAKLHASQHQRWALCYQNSYLFTVALFAALCNKRLPILLPNNQPGTLELLHEEFDGILTDIPTIKTPHLPDVTTAENLIHDLDKTQTITLFSSGSTGLPKRNEHTLQQLTNEIEALEQTFGATLKNSLIYATVSHQHIYGLLFSILWPLCTNRIICQPMLQFPESIETIIKQVQPATLISSPAFLTRISDIKITVTQFTIFSSGGLLKRSTAIKIHDAIGVDIIDVFGSTETGGVAFRKSSDTSWTPFKTVKVQLDQQTQCLQVQSPFFDSNDGFVMGDKAKLNIDDTFELLGRADRIVKIEGKRISLVEIENILKQHDFVEDAYAVPMESNRQYIAVAVVLTSKGNQHLASKGKRTVNLTLTEMLSQYFDLVLLPKQFRYIDSIPTNKQGKHVMHEIKSLFAKSSIRYPKEISNE